MPMRDYPPDSRLLPGARAPYPANAPAQRDDSLSLRQVFGVFRRHWKLVLALTVLGMVVGGFIGATQRPQYEATGIMRLALERKNLTGEPDAELGGKSDPTVTAVQLILSRSVLAAVVDTLGLQLRPDPELRFPRKLLAQVEVDPTASGDSIYVKFTRNRVTAKLGEKQISAPYGEVLDLGYVKF